MSSDKLRDELRASFKNRAFFYSRIFEELREEVGEQRAKAVLKRAIYRRGEEIGRQFQKFAPKDLAGLEDAFLAIIPDEGRMFEPHVERWLLPPQCLPEVMRTKMKTLVAVIAAILLLPIAAFCVFGFLATFEPTDRPRVFMTFRIGYGVVGITCLFGVVSLIGWALHSPRISS